MIAFSFLLPVLAKKETPFTPLPLKRFNEIVMKPGVVIDDYHVGNYTYPDHTYTVDIKDIPDTHDWGNVDGGRSYLTKSLNQHLPQYCGSCWAHGALSAMADRIKIARKGKGIEINLSVQYILNCGTKVAGSCYGGSAFGAYQFLKHSGHVPYDTANPYLACSKDSIEGFCGHVDTTCKALNIAGTCSTFSEWGGFCTGLDKYPNATVAHYGKIYPSVKSNNDLANAVKLEVFHNGPVACSLNASPLHDYKGGVYNDATADKEPNHIVEIVGFGVEKGVKFWNVRNSWGQYWGEMGFFRVGMGRNVLGLEAQCVYVFVGSFTEEGNYPCGESGTGCFPNEEREEESEENRENTEMIL